MRLPLEAQFGYALYDKEEESSEGEIGEDRFIAGVQHLRIDGRSFPQHQAPTSQAPAPLPALPPDTPGSCVSVMPANAGNAKGQETGGGVHAAEDDAMAGADQRDLSGNCSTQVLSTCSRPSLLTSRKEQGTFHRSEQQQNENPHVNENHTTEPGSDLAGGSKAAGGCVEGSGDGSAGGAMEVAGAKGNSKDIGVEGSSDHPEVPTIERGSGDESAGGAMEVAGAKGSSKDIESGDESELSSLDDED